ncbi:MAG: LutC/YkgG family protein [Granulosicoccaceae bacterium]
MSSREQIIGNIRHSLGRGELSAQQQEALQMRQNSRRHHARPATSTDLLEQLKQQMEKVQMSVTELATESEIGDAVSAYLREHQLPAAITVAPELAAIDWPDSLEVHTGAARPNDLNSVTGCVCAIAETGSVLMQASAQSPATLRFMPDNHMVVLRRDQIVAHLEDAWDTIRAQDGGVSRAVHINTGPSRTGDVEQVIEIGAHGPRRMHVFLLA